MNTRPVITLKRPRDHKGVIPPLVASMAKRNPALGEALLSAGVKPIAGKPTIGKPSSALPSSALPSSARDREGAFAPAASPPVAGGKKDARARLPLKVIRNALARLASRYPEVFGTDPPKPLKRGVHADLVAAGEDADLMGALLAFLTHSTPYLEAIAARGSQRHDLTGAVVEEVPVWVQNWAAGRLYERNRREKRAKGAENGGI